MRVLLLVAGQVVRVLPGHVEEDVGDQRAAGAGVELLY